MYTFDSRIRYSETDETGALSLLGVINYMQDCSTFQSEDIGLGVEYLEKKKRAWLLSSWRIVIDRYPVLGERIKIGTWATSSKGIYGYRDFVLMDQEGNYLVKAESVWIFCDTEKVKEIRVDYKKAAVLGEVLIPRVTKTGEDEWTIVLAGEDKEIRAVVWLKYEEA